VVKNVRIVLWRHAPTPANAAGTLQGQWDTEPGGSGLELGRVAAKQLVEMYGAPTAIFTSPLKRATATAQILADVAGVDDPIVEPGINQRSYGIWEGMHIDEVARRFPRELAVRDAGGDPDIPGWETGRFVGERVASALVSCTELVLAQISDDSPTSSPESAEFPAWVGGAAPVIVFVSHGSAIATGMRRLLGLPEEPQILGNLSHANWVELERLDGQWKVARYNYGPS